MIIKTGIPASPGVAIGPALVLDTEEYLIPRRTLHPGEVASQIRTLDAALASSREEVAQLRAATARKMGARFADIFAFHESVLADPALRDSVVELIEKNGYTAAYAFGQELNRRQRMFLKVAEGYIRERAKDLYDIEKRVLRRILGRTRQDLEKLSEPAVVVAHDLTPSQAASLDVKHVLAIAVNVGGPTSHTVIFARMLDIPAVVGLNDVTTEVSGGEMIVVDGTHGIVVADPDEQTIKRFEARAAKFHQVELELRELRDLPAVTLDGERVTLLANIELAEEARSAIESGAEGVGLYRTEFLYLSSQTMPTEEQQYQSLCEAIGHAGDRPMIIRTADLGADKHIPSMTQESEDNPFLGLRSIRYCLSQLDMFKTHLSAILRASVEGDVRVMFPMLTTLLELRQARTVLNDVMEDLDEKGVAYRRDLPIGMMVETPAAAMMCASFAREVDFMSIGTNDLTQYTLAVDRGNERVAYLYAPHSPPVMTLIKSVIETADRAGIDVNLCGEMAGNPQYCQLLLGMGLRKLSMAPKNIPAVKKIVRLSTIEQCRAVAARAMEYEDERHVVNFLRDELRKTDPDLN